MARNVAEKPLSRTEQRETDILDGAIVLFGEEGFHNVTTRKIAARAGVSEGTLFNYFSSKTELMRAILGRIYAELTANAEAILRDSLDTRERLQLLAENHVRVMGRDNALFMRLIQSYMNVDLSGYTSIKDSPLHKLNLSYAWVFDLSVKEGIQRGEIRGDVNISALRDLYFGGLEYLGRTLFLHESWDIMAERVSSVVEPLWQSMRPALEEDGEPRLDAACARIEAAATRLEKAGGGQ
jgi:AcrR family transcriptional regulator